MKNGWKTIVHTHRSACYAMALLLLLTGKNAVAQDLPQDASSLSRSIQHTEQVETLQSRIAQLTSDHGPYDERLLSPLANLARVYQEAGNSAEAAILLEQQLQIHRVNLGLYSAEQIPVVESLLQIHGETGDWGKLNDSLAYLSWLYQRNTSLEMEARLQGLHKLGTWHLRSLGSDIRERQAHHLVELARLDRLTAELAEAHLGENNPQLTPYLYDQALSDLYIALAIMLTSETAQDLMLLTEGIRERPVTGSLLSNLPLTSAADIEAVYGSRASTVIERSFKNNMDDNISKLKRIEELYTEAGDTEAEAMALMYRADSVLMRQQFEKREGNFAGVRRGISSIGAAMTYYREALRNLPRQTSRPQSWRPSHNARYCCHSSSFTAACRTPISPAYGILQVALLTWESTAWYPHSSPGWRAKSWTTKIQLSPQSALPYAAMVRSAITRSCP